MTKFIIAPEGLGWYTVRAKSPAMAYSSECCWFSPYTRVAIINTETNEVCVYTRQLDKNGNLIMINTVDLRSA